MNLIFTTFEAYGTKAEPHKGTGMKLYWAMLSQYVSYITAKHLPKAGGNPTSASLLQAAHLPLGLWLGFFVFLVISGL